MPAGSWMEIRTHRLGIDAAVALDLDHLARLRVAVARLRVDLARLRVDRARLRWALGCNGLRGGKHKRCGQERACGSRPGPSPVRRQGSLHHVPPVIPPVPMRSKSAGGAKECRSWGEMPP